jgi:hypothetical protein
MARKLPATRELSELGYEPLHDRVYKATWSPPDVEHFIYLNGGLKGLNAAFGFRNPDAETFAVRSIIKHGGDVFRAAIQYDERSSCTMRFSFSLFSPFWSRPIRGLFDPALGAKMQQMISEYVFPAVKDVTTIEKLRCLLLSDHVPCRWAVTNGAIRAAQIIALAGKCRKPAAETRAALEPHERSVANGFLKGSPWRENPGAYINRVLEDWNACSGLEA